MKVLVFYVRDYVTYPALPHLICSRYNLESVPGPCVQEAGCFFLGKTMALEYI
jgi:hypothetical protein